MVVCIQLMGLLSHDTELIQVRFKELSLIQCPWRYAMGVGVLWAPFCISLLQAVHQGIYHFLLLLQLGLS